MTKRSAGLLLWRRSERGIEFLLAHPGGPFWAKKDDGAWTIPKGLIEADEDPLQTARREFEEELGHPPPNGPTRPLGEIRQRAGKVVVAWMIEGDFDPVELHSNTFEVEWPPRSGKLQPFPEVDRVAFFDADTARRKLNPAQAELIDRALDELDPA